MPTNRFFVGGISARYAVISPPTWYRFYVSRPPKEPLASLPDRLRELKSTMGRIDHRLAEVRGGLESVDQEPIDKEDVSAALSLFDPVWDELYPAEKSRVINLLIERVEFDASLGRIRIRFRNLHSKNNGWRGPELCSGFLSHIHPVHFFYLVAEGGFEPFAAAKLQARSESTPADNIRYQRAIPVYINSAVNEPTGVEKAGREGKWFCRVQKYDFAGRRICIGV